MSATQREDGLGGIDLTTPVRAINRSDKPLVWKYARIKHTLLPGEQTYIPYLCMCLWQGDPRAVNMPNGRAHEQYRRNERERLAVLWGVYENHDQWAQVPKVDCYPIDSDVPFATVIADPDGLSVAGESRTNNELDLLRRETERMAAQLRTLQSTVAVRESQEAAIAGAGMDPEDLDHQVTTSRAITPEEATGQSMVGAAPVRKSPSQVAKKRMPEGEGPQVTKDGG